MFDLATRRKINRGFSDGFTRAVEIVATPVLLGFVGSLLDSWLETRPGFTIGFAVFGVCGIFAKLWLGYDREMRKEEAGVPARRARVVTPAPSGVDMRLEPGIGAVRPDDARRDPRDEGAGA